MARNWPDSLGRNWIFTNISVGKEDIWWLKGISSFHGDILQSSCSNDEIKSDQGGRKLIEVFQLQGKEFWRDTCQLQIQSGNSSFSISFYSFSIVVVGWFSIFQSWELCSGCRDHTPGISCMNNIDISQIVLFSCVVLHFIFMHSFVFHFKKVNIMWYMFQF